MRRREFLKTAGCACGGAAAHLAFPHDACAAAPEAFSKFDRNAQLNLADTVLRLAKQGGAAYADTRIGRNEHEYFYAREDRLEGFKSSYALGFGVRVLIDGSWGFAGSTLLSDGEAARIVTLAIENAKAARLIQATPVVIEDIPAYQEDWAMPMQVDPFTISVEEKSAKLLAINAAAQKAGANFVSSAFYIVREEKFFASSRGSRIGQSRTRILPYFNVTAIDKQSGKFATRESLAAPRGAGWEYITGYDFLGEAALAADQARQKLAAKPVAPRQYDLVIDPQQSIPHHP